jgi:cytochrome c-type biogenesis protein CcsB
MSSISKIFHLLLGPKGAMTYVALFAIAIGIGTFIENDFGTSAAQVVVYRATWFSVLLFLFCLSLVYNIYRFRMVQQGKWALLTFHAAMIIILIGAAVTRYAGYEGIMHIREGDASNSILSAETFVSLDIHREGKKYQVDEPVLFSSLGDPYWRRSYTLGSDEIVLEVNDFIPNPEQYLSPDPNGEDYLKIVFGGANGREEYYLAQGETRRIRNVLFNFSAQKINGAINLSAGTDGLLINADRPLIQRVMATQEIDTLMPEVEWHPLRLRSLYSDGQGQFVFGEFSPSSKVQIRSTDRKVKNESMTALQMDVTVNGVTQEIVVYGQKGLRGRPRMLRADGIDLGVSYGSKVIELPFSVKLYDFIMDRYPGTDSPLSYASEVQLIDPRQGIEKDYRIYMNHILDHDGYRFFQSSYDKDELGTYLSVNHDFWGTWISYIGYILLTLGMIMTLFSKKSRFHILSQQLDRIRKKRMTANSVLPLFILTMLLSLNGYSQTEAAGLVSEEHAALWSTVVVQDMKGRMKPMHTLDREVMRKVLRSEELDGADADQVVLSMFVDRENWLDRPIIKLGRHERIPQLIKSTGGKAAYRDFFDEDGRYKLAGEMRRISELQPIDRGVLEKELIKIDERVNIMNMVFGGHFFRIIPLAGDPENTWISTHGAGHGSSSDPVAERFFPAYTSALKESMRTGDYSLSDQLLNELKQYQIKMGADLVPSDTALKAEIQLNELNVFNRLAAFYAILGLMLLTCLFISIFRPQMNLNWVNKILFILLVAGFLFHTLGLGLRWYVSGRAPWSNGYESMIYIAWTTVLAGLLFARRSFGALAATMILSATVLLVAMLSYLDPEITPLVPVLRSYWLTIHVSLEAGSYGFLALGAVIGIINLLLMLFLSKKNEQRVHALVTEMSYLSEMTLIGGIFMISIGTYLGGVWANESWGRYWGWDAKETWALVTILVYAFILHMRLIPGLKGLFAFNFASLFGLSSVIMTYYGVNYYLSGLHSYAAGDPAPIPLWVYITVIALTALSVLAYIRQRNYKAFR